MYVFLNYILTLHIKDRPLLEKFQQFFGVIYKNGVNLVNFSIKSIKDIQLIINHFDTYPLQTKKLNEGLRQTNYLN